MHNYVIRNYNRLHTVFIIATISIVLNTLINEGINLITSHFPDINKIYVHFETLGFSISAFLIFSLIWKLYSNVIWKISSKRKLTMIPYIAGTWDCKGLGKKNNNSAIENIWHGKIEIQQSYEKLFITLTTDKSKSHSYSLAGDIEIRDKKEFVLSYLYENEPYKNEEGLNRHKGFCCLTFNLKNNTANGKYYTDNERGSYGTMNLIKENK